MIKDCMSALYQGVFVERFKSTTKPYSNRRHLDKKKLWRNQTSHDGVFFFVLFIIFPNCMLLNQMLCWMRNSLMRAKCHNFFYYHCYSTDSLRNATPLGRKRIEYYFIARTQKGISNNSILKLWSSPSSVCICSTEIISIIFNLLPSSNCKIKTYTTQWNVSKP